MKLVFGSAPLLGIALCISSVSAHTYVWSVWVNGVDQGTGYGIRLPAYNGPPLSGSSPFGQGSGFRNGPVRDVNAIDLRCNVLGDIQNPNTITVAPNDILTLEWHHESRLTTDDIIASSHLGAGLVYISPDPPVANSWVKIQEEGEPTSGSWYVAGKLSQRAGKQDVRIPPNLAPGHYLVRGELLTLHEAEVSHAANPNRGVQIYVSCVQIEVTGSGTVKLPAGVSFPGAYSYSDPGIVYNLYYQPAGAPLYQIPGPPVWSGAAPSPPAPAYGSTKGEATATKWNTWIGNGFSTSTLATSLTIVSGASTATRAYTPNWPTTYVTPTPDPSSTSFTSTTSISTATTTTPTTITSITPTPTTPTTTPTGGGGGTVAKYGQCGGSGYTGATGCVAGTTCTVLNDWYYQCL